MSHVFPAPSFEEVLAALRRSHDRVAALLAPLTDDQLAGPSYDTEWTIAQVASHLGSGAEVFELFLEAGLKGSDAPRLEQIQPIWDRWNAKPASEQAHDFLVADAALLERVDALPHEERESWKLDLFGGERDLTGLLQLRVPEHTVHTWDIEVALNPGATVAEDAIDLVIGTLPTLVGYVGQPLSDPITVDVRTSGPDRRLLLDLTADGATLAIENADVTAATAVLLVPAEAFVRLLYGRLDTDHTPASVSAEGVDLDTLRRAFPGV